MVLALAGDSTMTKCLPLRAAALGAPEERAPSAFAEAFGGLVATAVPPPAADDALDEVFPLVFAISVVALSGCESDWDHGPLGPGELPRPLCPPLPSRATCRR